MNRRDGSPATGACSDSLTITHLAAEEMHQRKAGAPLAAAASLAIHPVIPVIHRHSLQGELSRRPQSPQTVLAFLAAVDGGEHRHQRAMRAHLAAKRPVDLGAVNIRRNG